MLVLYDFNLCFLPSFFLLVYSLTSNPACFVVFYFPGNQSWLCLLFPQYHQLSAKPRRRVAAAWKGGGSSSGRPIQTIGATKTTKRRKTRVLCDKMCCKQTRVNVAQTTEEVINTNPVLYFTFYPKHFHWAIFWAKCIFVSIFPKLYYIFYISCYTN